MALSDTVCNIGLVRIYMEDSCLGLERHDWKQIDDKQPSFNCRVEEPLQGTNPLNFLKTGTDPQVGTNPLLHKCQFANTLPYFLDPHVQF